MAAKKKGTGLRFINVNDFNLIPVHLIEQIEPKVPDPTIFYKLSQQINSSPFNTLGVFADKDKKVKGFMWGNYNPIDQNLHIHMLSIDPEYHGMGIVGEATNIAKKIKQQMKAVGIKFKTITPERFEGNGWERSDQVFMEEA